MGKVKADLDLRKLEIFYWVAELKSFPKPPSCSRCASPLSARMSKNWKRRPAASYFYRMHGRVSLTPWATCWLNARKACCFQARMRAAVEQFHGTLSGELWVGGSSIPGEYLLPPSSARSKKISRG